MRTSTLEILLAAGAFLLASASARAENAVYSCTGANGVAELTNAPNGNTCEKLVAGTTTPAPAAAPAAAPASAKAAPAAADADPADADAAADPAAPDPKKVAAEKARHELETRLAQRREAAIQQTNDAYTSDGPVAGVNPAVNRRYLMTNRADYQRAIGMLPPQ